MSCNSRTKQILGFMKQSVDEIPVSYILEAAVSTPYLAKLAVGDARGTVAQADEAELAAIEAQCLRLKVPGWREGEAEGRPPFVRRNLLLVAHQMNQARMSELTLSEKTKQAQDELTTKLIRMLEMLFKYCLHNRWVKAALAVTECQALVANGLWDAKEDDCRELMRDRMAANGLKLAKLSMTCSANDCRPGGKARSAISRYPLL